MKNRTIKNLKLHAFKFKYPDSNIDNSNSSIFWSRFSPMSFENMFWCYQKKMECYNKVCTGCNSTFTMSTEYNWIHVFFTSKAFFNLTSQLLNTFMNWASNVAYVLLNTYKYHHTVTLSIFTISMSMSRSRSIYFMSMWSIFHFDLYFHYD